MSPAWGDGLGRSILLVALATGRILPVFIVVPAFAGRTVPAIVRLGLSVLVALLVYPALATGQGEIPAALPGVLALFVKEVVTGVLLAFLVSIPFWAAESAGRLSDASRGAAASELLAPAAGVSSSPLGAFLLQLSTVVFFAIDGHLLFLRAFAASYEALPVAGWPAAGPEQVATGLVVSASSHLLLAAVGMAAPVLAAMLLTDLALGVVGRVAPQVPLYFVGLPARAVLGVLVLLLATSGVLLAFRGELAAALAIAGSSIERLGGR